MLRLHLTVADLARVVVRAVPDPLLEAQYAMRALRGGTDERLRRRYHRLVDHGLGGALRPALCLVSVYGYTPDFLTPVTGHHGDLDAGIEAVRATPRHRLRADLAGVRDTAYSRRLADGDPAALTALTRGLRTAYEAFVAPEADQAARRIAAERAARVRDLTEEGLHRMLGSLCRDIVWRPPVLELTCPVDSGDGDLHLGGRGIVLQPTFVGRDAMITAGADGPLVLSYPVADPAEGAADGAVADGLADALGRTRSRVLAAVRYGATTSQIAGRLGISAASASEHARVLRRARLVTTRRLGPATLHTLTPLGHALLDGHI
ncbi:winged helix-turn-helix domain-containing protein [Polymorphospora sp. NPDC050346]|uniref:ArsR/SmtB family transcription factor n=1 Tax=Polymorphospora sp. NPDC050346 TaxID=3155780 RepID=UPI0033D511A5